MAASDIVYDGFSFSENGLVITSENHMIVADRSNQIEKIPGRTGGVLVQSELGTKPIPIAGYYIGTSISDAQTMYDTLTQMLNRIERPLDIPHAGSMRRFIATPTNVVVEEPQGLNRLTFSFEFVVPSGGSEEQSNQLLFSDTVITTPITTIPLTVQGSEDARPFITLTFTAVSGGTGKSISIRNARDFIGITISRNFVTGDVVTIDSRNFQIYINGTLTEPDGRMPKWAPGSGSLYYSDTFTSRTVNISGKYQPKYL